MESEISWGTGSRSFDEKLKTETTFHADFKKNQLHAGNFIRNISSQLLNGMSVMIKSSQHFKHNLLAIGFKLAKFPEFMHCINLNQSSIEYQKELDQAFNNYHKMAKGYNEKLSKEVKPVQQDLWEDAI